jgi:hypothetical protein
LVAIAVGCDEIGVSGKEAWSSVIERLPAQPCRDPVFLRFPRFCGGSSFDAERSVKPVVGTGIDGDPAIVANRHDTLR